MNCHPKWECGNYVTRIVNMGDSNLVACGTNYGNPDAIVLEPGKWFSVHCNSQGATKLLRREVNLSKLQQIVCSLIFLVLI